MKTHIICVMDTSGSMGSIAVEAFSGLDDYLAQQAKLPGQATVSIIRFSSASQVVCKDHPLGYQPRMANTHCGGMTALNDAIGDALNLQSPADATIVVIVTDGAENSSKRFTREQVKLMVEARKEAGWQFIFMAANQDAVLTAGGYGIPKMYAHTFSADRGGMASAMSYASQTTTSLRGTTF